MREEELPVSQLGSVHTESRWSLCCVIQAGTSQGNDEWRRRQRRNRRKGSGRVTIPATRKNATLIDCGNCRRPTPPCGTTPGNEAYNNQQTYYDRTTSLKLEKNISLTAKSVPAGTKNSRSEGFLLAKLLKHTAHKHPHHDGAVSPSSAMFLMEEHTPPPGASLQGVGRGRRRRVLSESIK